MNRTLKRPMFRIGGSAGTGITSGLDQPQKMANGGRTGYQQGSMPSFQASGLPGFLTSFGLNLLATPPAGNIFQTAGMAAREPFDQLQASQARQRQLESEKEFLRSERLAGQEFEETQLEKRLGSAERIALMKNDDTLSLAQLTQIYMEDFQGDANAEIKASNKAKYVKNILPDLRDKIGDSQIGGIIDVDFSDRKKALRAAQMNKSKVGKVFFDVNSGQPIKLIRNPETNKLDWVPYDTTTQEVQDTSEVEILSEANENEFKPKQNIKEVFQPGLTEADQQIIKQVEENKKKIEEGMKDIPDYNIYR